MSNNKSMKMKQLTKIKNFIANIINEDQQIKRYCSYLTNTPLMDKGMTLDGKIISQPDITESLINEDKGNIIPYRFTEDIIKDKRVIIFVYKLKGDLRKTIGENYFAVDIFVPYVYDILEELGQERNVEIASRICDLIDGKSIDKTLGEIEILEYEDNRLNRTSDYNICSLLLKIEKSNIRNR